MNENMNDNMNDNKKQNLPTSIVLFIRIAIGGYLMYLAYQLLTGSDSSMNIFVTYGFCAVFIIAGILLIIFSLKMMIKGEYIGGAADFSEDEKSL